MASPGKSNKLQHAGLPALLSIEQVADATRMSPKTIRRRVADGTLKAHRIGPRLIPIERDSVLALLPVPDGGGVSRKQYNRPLKQPKQSAICKECGQQLTTPKTIARRLCRSCWRVHKVVASDAT
jgi:excisionase family DNA binding protein